MNRGPFPPAEEITICFAHVAYPLAEAFEKRQTGIDHFQSWQVEDLEANISKADVLLISGFWSDSLLERAERLRFIQSIGAGTDQFPLAELERRGIRLASASGVNSNAVSEHAAALMLALARHLPSGRDHQRRHFWRPMISQIDDREDELGGKTLLIVGLGRIGSRLARIAQAFDMNVVATRREPERGGPDGVEVRGADEVRGLLPRADYVALTCPLTAETRHLIDADALESMKPSAYLINVARGGCVDEPALLDALRRKQIAGAGIDHFWDEPLPEESPFWDVENVMITPHTGGETRRYEENLLDILMENLDRLWRREHRLRNEVV